MQKYIEITTSLHMSESGFSHQTCSFSVHIVTSFYKILIHSVFPKEVSETKVSQNRDKKGECLPITVSCEKFQLLCLNFDHSG